MIYRNGKEITTIVKGSKIITMIYYSGRLVWQAIRSCFGVGAWSNDKPWDNNEGWKN